MLNLTKVKLPAEIEIGGQFFSIKTDFRNWFNFSRIIQKETITFEDVSFLFTNEDLCFDNENVNINHVLASLIDFYNPPCVVPRNIDLGPQPKVIDYIIDGDLIYAAFYEQYGIDLLETDKNGKIKEIHWHKFLALLHGLHGTKLNDIEEIRSYNPGVKMDYEQQRKLLQQQWELPSKETEEAQKALDDFNKLFN